MGKCLKNLSGGEIKRFTEKNQKDIETINFNIKSGNWFYVPKKQWKEQENKLNIPKKSDK